MFMVATPARQGRRREPGAEPQVDPRQVGGAGAPHVCIYVYVYVYVYIYIYMYM